MIDQDVLAIIAELGLGLAGFSGVAIVLTSTGTQLSRLEKDRLGIMLGSSLGAMFLALLPVLVAALGASAAHSCRIANGIMAAYTAGFLRYYAVATLEMRGQAPELVKPLPFGSVLAGHALNLVLQSAAALGLVSCAPAYLLGLYWLLFHGAFQFGRILFIRPSSALEAAAPAAPGPLAVPAAGGEPRGAPAAGGEPRGAPAADPAVTGRT